jgi:hypothetical protein
MKWGTRSGSARGPVSITRPSAACPATDPAERPGRWAGGPPRPRRHAGPYSSAPSSRSTRRTIASDDAYVESIP